MNSDRRERPRVSVLIPTYNRADLLAEALESVLVQTFEDFEVVVADDGSTDSTRDVIDTFTNRDERIKPLLGEQNLGMAGNLNRGLAACRAELIARLDSDDLMVPTRLERQGEALDARPDASACTSDARMIDLRAGAEAAFSRVVNPIEEAGPRQLLWGHQVLPSAMTWRASATPRRGFEPRLGTLCDPMFIVELAARGPCIGVKEQLCVHRFHGSNATADATMVDRALEEPLIMAAILEARYPELRRDVRGFRATRMLIETRRTLRRKQPYSASAFAFAAVHEIGFVRTGRLAAQLLRRDARRRAGVKEAAEGAVDPEELEIPFEPSSDST
jgi:glycosyltransferase involved in cell wall biosynthesis